MSLGAYLTKEWTKLTSWFGAEEKVLGPEILADVEAAFQAVLPYAEAAVVALIGAALPGAGKLAAAGAMAAEALLKTRFIAILPGIATQAAQQVFTSLVKAQGSPITGPADQAAALAATTLQPVTDDARAAALNTLSGAGVDLAAHVAAQTAA